MQSCCIYIFMLPISYSYVCCTFLCCTSSGYFVASHASRHTETPLTQLQPRTLLQIQGTRRHARWLEFLASFRPNVVYVQGRVNSAHILSRRPHEPQPTLPDLGQSNGGSFTEPLALSPGQLVGSGSGPFLAAFPRGLTNPGNLYMLGRVSRGHGTPEPGSAQDRMGLTKVLTANLCLSTHRVHRCSVAHRMLSNHLCICP